MTLVLCPECRAEVSDRAGQCPSCGYPLSGSEPPAPIREPQPSRIQTYISRRFAVAWTGATGAALFFMLVVGRGGPDEGGAAATVGALALLASLIPVWWRTRRAARTDGTAIPAELERRVEERLQAAEEQIRRRLGEMEDGTRHVMELEERIDFAERLLTKHRDDQLHGPSGSGKSP